MARVAVVDAVLLHGRFADAGSAQFLFVSAFGDQRCGERRGRTSAIGAGTEFDRGHLGDELPPRGRVVVAEQPVEVDVLVPVVGVAIGHGELERLEDGVCADLVRRVEALVVETLEDLQRLQQHRPLPPRTDLRDRVPAEVDGDGVFETGFEAGDVLESHHSGVIASGRMPVRGGDEVGDRLGDESGLPFPARRADPVGTRVRGLTGVDETAQGVSVGAVEHRFPGDRDPALGHPVGG